jgi:hypothetical protein
VIRLDDHYGALNPLAVSSASLDTYAVGFDAEALGSLRGLEAALDIEESLNKIWVYLDNTAAIWYLRGTPSQTSQRHFLVLHTIARAHLGGAQVK